MYTAFIAVLTDSGSSGFENRRHKSREELRQELTAAFEEAGFVDPEGTITIPGRDSYSEIPSTSIGPLLPAIAAILEVDHGIDSTEAVRQYRPDSFQTILPDEARPEQDWEANLRNAPGFDPDAEAYVYVLEVERLSDSSRWFYVGKREDRFTALLGYIQGHAHKFTRSRVVTYNDPAVPADAATIRTQTIASTISGAAPVSLFEPLGSLAHSHTITVTVG